MNIPTTTSTSTSVPDCLQFKQVLYKNLIHNHKYIVQIEEGDCKGDLYIGLFERKKKYKTFELTNIISGYINITGYTTDKVKNLTYYRINFKKHKIQEEMESRAVNKILQKITGDDTFNYN